MTHPYLRARYHEEPVEIAAGRERQFLQAGDPGHERAQYLASAPNVATDAEIAAYDAWLVCAGAAWDREWDEEVERRPTTQTQKESNHVG